MHRKRKNKKYLKSLLLIIIVIGVVFISYKEVLNNKDVIENKINIMNNDEYKNIDDYKIFKKYYKKAVKIVKNMSLKEKVGQLFLVRYNKDDVEYLSNFYPGGYILFAKDFQNNTKEQMKKEIETDQKENKFPLIMAVDEEGGYVTRVSRFKQYRDEKFLSSRAYYNQGGYALVEQIEKEKATLLKDLGINLNLAPVSDISTSSTDFIYSRAFQGNTEETSIFVKNMVKYANNNKINSCLKHFPGYGNNKDTHTGIAIDERSYEEIENNDYKPFIAGIEENVPSILVSHNIVKSIDSEYPASLSKKVNNELRNKLNYTGIIMTDDLAMDAVKEYVSNNTSATLAVNAGNDMIITSDFLTMKNEVLNSVEEGKIQDKEIAKEEKKVKEVLALETEKLQKRLRFKVK
mgnify:CR=1 FL=1